MRELPTVSTKFTLSAFIAVTSSLTAPMALTQQDANIELGKLQSGAEVSFTRGDSSSWGIKIAGGPAPTVEQTKPAAIEVYRADNDIQELAVAYKTIQKIADRN